MTIKIGLIHKAVNMKVKETEQEVQLKNYHYFVIIIKLAIILKPVRTIMKIPILMIL